MNLTVTTSENEDIHQMSLEKKLKLSMKIKRMVQVMERKKRMEIIELNNMTSSPVIIADRRRRFYNIQIFKFW